MKNDNHSRLSSLLALAVMLFAVLACSSTDDTTNSTNTTSTTNTTTSSSSTTNTASTSSSNAIKITSVQFKRDDGTGKPGEDVKSFKFGDKKLYCEIDWDNPQAGKTITFSWVAVDAGGDKEVKIKDFSITTENEKQNFGTSSISLTEPFPKGKYRVDVTVDGKPAYTAPFTIE